MRRSAFYVLLGSAMLVAGCTPNIIQGTTPGGGKVSAMFYPGGSKLKDLVIMDGTNYFGHAMYQYDDPLGDVGFRFEDGRRVQAECTSIGKDFIGKDKCLQYTVYRSSFEAIPEGTVIAGDL